MTPEQEALVGQVMGDPEMLENLLTRPAFQRMWRMHAWAFADQMDLQTHILDKSKRTQSGWPREVEENTGTYIKHRVAEIVRAHNPTAPAELPRASGENVERLRALINGGNKS